MIPPINFPKWIAEHADKLQPPVNNFCLWNEKVANNQGGPNHRNDFHVNQTEEWFYQHRGDMLLRTFGYEKTKCFCCLVDFKQDTIGIVIERKRPAEVLDTLQWYCQQCSQIVFKESFYCIDLGKQLKPVIDKYASDETLRKCKSCGFVNPMADKS